MKGRGSIALLLIAAAILLRPWELHHGTAGASEHLTGRVVRAVDGDTLEVAIDGGSTETVRLIGMLSRVSCPTPRLPVVAQG
ncbi:MAG: hypothetical protein JST59_21765 [Actinobacteria bacterium]|nr:hypothetical protein [Actinomycetota bacterium]